MTIMGHPPKRPKVCILIDTRILGGPGRGLFQILKRSQALAFDYILVNFEYAGPPSEFNQTAQREGLNLRTIASQGPLDPLPIKRLLQLYREEGCTILQTHGYKTHVIGALARVWLGIPWIAFAHGWTTENLKVRLYHLLDKITLRFADIAVAVSTPLFKTLMSIRRKERTTVYIPNAVDPGAIAGSGIPGRIRKELGIGPDELVIGCFGRLSSEKGQAILLQALSLWDSTVVPLPHLLLVGDGPDRAGLEEICSRAKLTPKVHFLGYQSLLRDYYEALDAYVLPSLSEGLPNVVLEAMAFSRPVIATSVGSTPEVVTSETGWLVSPGQAKELCDALIKALKDRPKLVAIGIEGKKLVAHQFDPDERAKKIRALYERLSSSGNY